MAYPVIPYDMPQSYSRITCNGTRVGNNNCSAVMYVSETTVTELYSINSRLKIKLHLIGKKEAPVNQTVR